MRFCCDPETMLLTRIKYCRFTKFHEDWLAGFKALYTHLKPASWPLGYGSEALPTRRYPIGFKAGFKAT